MSTSPEKTSVQVAVRIRPITEEDLKSCPTKYQHTVITSSQFTPNQVIVQDGDKKYPYNFDHVFGPEDAQKDVFEKSVLKLVEKFLEGYNVTILAYGQTSSGKTHTMGTADNANMPADAKGIIPRSMATLFNCMNGAQYKSRKFSMKVSFIEIYNEELIDLLGEGEIESRPQVLIREDNKGNILWSGLKELQVNNVEDVMSHLTHGSTHRQVGATEMNSKSSRSHAIFSITLSQQKFIPSSSASASILSPPSTPAPGDRPTTPGMKLPSSRSNSRLNKRADDGEWVTITSKFHFVDLAGSERLKRTSAISERAKEGISINSGLLALGNVISALGDTNKAKHTTHIPYRDSKLTRLLQDSLGGNAQTLMIACVSPTAFNIHETHSTIKYANRARNIKNTVSLNQEETGWNDIEHLQSLVMKLRNEIKALRNATYSSGTNHSNNNNHGDNSDNNHNNNNYNSPTTSTMTSGIPMLSNGRTTPMLSNVSGRTTPLLSNASGRTTPLLSNVSGRTTPVSGRDTPSYLKRPSTPSSSLTLNSQKEKEKEIETLEDQLIQLKKSYVELTQKYAKTSAELAQHQDNSDGIISGDIKSNIKKPNIDKNGLATIEEEKLIKNISASFQEAVEPVIEEYEKSISQLESQLALNKAALSHSETLMQENEYKLFQTEQADQQNRAQIIELKNKLARLNERESSTENYVKDLEGKLESCSQQQKLDQEMIQDLKSKIAKLKDIISNSEMYIAELEDRLASSDDHVSKLTENIGKLEQRLIESEQEYRELEQKSYNTENDREKRSLLVELDDREERIIHLERKVEELIGELENLRKHHSLDDDDNLNIMHIHEKSTSSTTSDTSLFSSNDNSNEEKERLNMILLEGKLSKLQKVHDNTCKEFDDLKAKYQSCLQEMQELEIQILDAKSIHDDKSTTPTTPTTPDSSLFNNSNYRMSLPVNLRSSSSSSPTSTTSSSYSTIATSVSSIYESNHKEQPLINNLFNNSKKSQNQNAHRKSRTLSTELKSNERRDLAHISIVQKLQDDLKQLSSLHEDKTQGLDAVKSEFARLEIEYREKLEIVEELREEIKRRDALAQLEEMSVTSNSDYRDYVNSSSNHNNNQQHHNHNHHHRGSSLNGSGNNTNNNNSEYNSYYSGVSTTTASEIDHLDIVQRLKEEIEQLKAEQRTTMEIMSQREKANNDSDNGNEEEFSQVQRQKEIDDAKLKLEGNGSSSTNAANNGKETDQEIITLRQQVEKLQMEIEAKGHTISALLLPSNEHQDIIRRLEDELQEVREAHRIATLKEKSNKLATISESAEYDNNNTDNGINGSNSNDEGNNNTNNNRNGSLSPEIAYSSDKLEQNIDENVKELEEKVKDLEVQLTNAKEAQHIPTPRSSTSASSSASTLYSTDSTQKIISNLQAKLVDLQEELLSKADDNDHKDDKDKSENIKTELELVSSMQQQLEILRVDVKCKYEIIESSKRELIDKGILQQKLRGKEAEAKSLQHQLSGFKNSENEMKQQILQLQEKLKSFKSSSNNNNEVNESLENEINDVKKEMIKAKDNENFTIERLKVLALEETKLQSELDRLKKIEIAQCERIKVLESSLSSSQEQNKNLSVVEKDFTKLKDELSLVKENEIEHKKVIEKLESKLKDSESEIRVLQVQLDELRKESDERIETIKSSELKLREEEAAKQLIKETDNDNEIKRLKEEIELLNKQEIDQSEKIKSLESQLKLAQENPEIANLKSELVNHEANESLLKDTIQDLETKLSEAQQDSKKLSSIQSELKLLSELDAEQKSSISQLQDQLVTIQNEKDSVVKEMESMKQDFETQKNLVFTLEKDLNLTKTELTKAKEDNQSSSKKHEDLSALLSQTVEERDQLDKKTKDLVIEIEGLKEMNITDDKEISRLNSELSEAKDEMIRQNELLSELNSKLTNVEKERDESADLIDELAKEIERKETEKKEAVETLESNISNLKSQLEEAKNSSVLDQETISKLNEKLDLLQSQLDESKELDKKRSQKIKELEDRIQETNVKVQEKDNALNNNVELIMGLEENLKNLKSQLENAEKFKSAEAQELESKILELEEQIKNSPTCEDLEAVKELYDKQVELTKELESKLAAADIENSKIILQLTNELVLAKETEESLRKSVKEVEDDLKIKENDLNNLNNNLEKLKEELKQIQSNESQQVELISSLEAQLEQTKNQRDKEIDKFTEANIEIEQLQEKCADLQNEIDEIQKEAMLQSHQSVDSGLYEELNQQLKKSQEENQIHIEHSQQLENSIQKLESEKSILDQNNMALEQNVVQLEKEIELLADEYSEADLKYKETESNLSKQKTRIAELEMEIDANKKQHTNSSTTLSQLASASETLRKTNNDLNKKLVDTEENVSKLNQKVKSLEQELAHYKTINDDINTSKEFAQELKDKIKNLEYERDGLEEANKAFVEEKKKLDDKIDSLLQQLQSSGRDGNKTAAQLAGLNKKIISLEKEISITKEQSKKDSEEMEKEIIRLLEVNKKLESGNEQEYSPKLPQQQQQRQKVRSSSDSGDSYDSGFSSLSPQASNPRLNKNVKAMKHETTIAEQLVIIKTLQDRIAEFEKQQLEETHKSSTPADLDAVGGFRLVRTDSNSSTELMKNAIKNNLSATPAAYMDAPPTPPPNLPLPPVPSSPSSSTSSLASNSVSLPMTPPLSPPPKSPLPPIPDSEVNTTSIQDLTSEVQKLNKKLGKLENENSQSQQLIETLEGALNSNEGELKIAKQQLQVLQKEKTNLRQQVKALNDQLEEVNAQFEHAQSSVQEEKKVIESIESVLNQERKAKEEAEKARRQLENRMEELIQKKNKFMCF